MSKNIFKGRKGLQVNKLLIYLKGYKKECILAPLFKMLEASFELLIPLIIAAMIDTGISSGDKPYLIKMCLILLGLGIIGLVVSVTAQYFSAKAAVGFSTELRHHLFKHLLGLSYTEIDTLGTSTMITRMTSDVNQAQNGVNLVLRLFLRSPFIVLGAMLMAYRLNGKAALIFAGAIIILSIIIFGIMILNIPMIKKVQGKLDAVLDATRENLLGVRVIRAFCKEQEEVEQFIKKNNELTTYQKKAGIISALMNPLTYIVINVAVAQLIWTGALEVHMGTLSQGQVIALYNYMSQILIELIKLANLIVVINKALASAKRIADVFEIKSTMEDGDIKIGDKTKPSIVFEHVSLKYKGAGEESLTDIHFSVEKGQTVGIIGGTGSGKSSLVHLIPRFYDVTKGNIILDGINIKQYTFEALRDKIAVVMQKAVLFKGDIESNLKWGKKEATEQDMEEAIRYAQAQEIVQNKGGLKAEIEQGGSNLSGGQRQRMSIARALIKKPEILILDDSTSALDFITEAQLKKAIGSLDYAPTIFIVSQRASSIQHADQIIVLEDGYMVGKGTHQELLTSCEVYQEIYYSQFKKGENR